jgi:hypothetical protein
VHREGKEVESKSDREQAILLGQALRYQQPIGRQDKVLEYVIHRIEDGANLREVLQEEYVRRNATADEIQSILENPRLIQAAGEQLREDFSSGKLDPHQRRS